MATLNENQTRLFKRCPQWGTFRPGSVKCEGYRHAIGAENGLRGLARLGYLARGWQGQGIVYQMTEEGRAALTALDKPAPVVSIHDPRYPAMPHLSNLP